MLIFLPEKIEKFTWTFKKADFYQFCGYRNLFRQLNMTRVGSGFVPRGNISGSGRKGPDPQPWLRTLKARVVRRFLTFVLPYPRAGGPGRRRRWGCWRPPHGSQQQCGRLPAPRPRRPELGCTPSSQRFSLPWRKRRWRIEILLSNQ